METLHQSPTDPDFVRNPCPFYAGALRRGPMHVWADYDMIAAFSHDAVHALLRDRRFGCEIPPELARPGLTLTAPPEYSNSYHFHDLTRLMVTA